MVARRLNQLEDFLGDPSVSPRVGSRINFRLSFVKQGEVIRGSNGTSVVLAGTSSSDVLDSSLPP